MMILRSGCFVSHTQPQHFIGRDVFKHFEADDCVSLDGLHCWSEVDRGLRGSFDKVPVGPCNVLRVQQAKAKDVYERLDYHNVTYSCVR